MSLLHKNILFLLGVSFSFIAWLSFSKPVTWGVIPSYKSYAPPQDTIKKGKAPKKRNAVAAPSDRYGDPYSNKQAKSPLLLGNPSNITTEVEADSSHENYTIREKAGDVDYRPPATMTFDEYQKYKNKEMLQNYWRTKAAGPLGERQETKKDGVKGLKIPVRGLEGPFGSNFVDIQPNGAVTLDFGGRWQRVNNPIIPVRSQRNGGFEFDQQISMNVVGKIGDKLKLTANWDTKATFEFQNNIKLEFTGHPEDIIQKIEAGFVSMPVNSSLISGAQNLFGIKTKLQFGRLGVTSVISSQKGKVDEVRFQGGSQARDFELVASAYDENRHFFLGQFFRNNYNKALEKLPIVASGVNITKVNVYITNRVNNTTANKNIIAYQDLGEANTYREHLQLNAGPSVPADNNVNKLIPKFNIFSPNPSNRDPSTVEQSFSTVPRDSFASGTDYTIITSARQLLPTEFTFNSQLGYISLNTPLSAQDFLAVSYEYTYTNPTTGANTSHKVGEVVGDKTADSSNQLIVLKMIKPIGTKPALPTWNLMMKNVYQLGATQISRDNFQLRIIYRDDSTGMDTPFLQGLSDLIGKKSLLNLLKMDRLNPNNDPPADGNFDFIEGVTIDSKYGRVIFPVIEPFGQTLNDVMPTQGLKDKYVFEELYKLQLGDVRNYTQKNKFYLKGKFQSSSNSDIMLPGINIAPGSVTIFAGSNLLHEGTDYQIDYNLGRVKILNEGVLASQQEIRIKYEKQDLFNFRRKTFLGSRFDYKVSNDINIGATILHQKEAPQITRTNVGDEPTNNTIWGVDLNFKKDSKFITKVIDKLPIIQTKVPSSVTFAGEFAQLIPGHPGVIDKNEGGTSFIDDFEGAETPYNLMNSLTSWHLGAIPKISNPNLNASDRQTLNNEYNSIDLDNSFHRAKLAWYIIDYSLYTSSDKYKGVSGPDLQNKFVKQINTTDIIQGYQNTSAQLPEKTLDLAYFPNERGPYNYNTTNLQPDGTLANPQMNWGAITRDLKNDIDFDNANIQYLEFWMMNPFLKKGKTASENDRIPIFSKAQGLEKNKPLDPAKSSGKLYFNLGDITEDVMSDKQHFFENGLPDPAQAAAQPAKTTAWGKVPTVQYTSSAFESSAGARASQDVGMDGLNDDGERGFAAYQNFINSVNTTVTSGDAREAILSDPSADNFNYYLGNDQDAKNNSVLMRYKNFNGMENNSPESSNNSFTPSSSNFPDNEDLNQDNTINFDNNYYEYAIDIAPDKFVVGENYIVGSSFPKDDSLTEYFQFRIPVRSPTDTVGTVSGFKSIRFLRMYMNGFAEPVILRFARLQLVANQWRVNTQTNFKNNGADPQVKINLPTISTVNVEENTSVGSNTAISNYMIPPNYSRDQDITSQVNRQLSEQSLRLCVDQLPGGYQNSVFKNMTLNMLNYKRLSMFLHAETGESASFLKDKGLVALVRIGTDLVNNYYEIEVPLYFTRPLVVHDGDATKIWRTENTIDIDLQAMTQLKAQRNGKNLFSFGDAYPGTVDNYKVNVVGSPDMSSVQVIMIGVMNPAENGSYPHSACIWADELRLSGFVEQAGWAATSRMNIKLADLANISATAKYTGIGFGSLDQKVSQRSTASTTEWGIQGNMGLEKFLPTNWGLRLPLFASYNTRVITPKFNPLDPDVLLKTSLNNIEDQQRRSDYKKLVLDQQTIRTINLTNIQKVKTKPDAKHHFYDVENLSLTVGYNETKRTNINLKDYSNKVYNAGLGYTFNNPAKPIEPFKNFKFLKSPYLKLIKDFNFSILPSSITFRADLNRRLTTTQYWEGNPADGIAQDPFYEKSFTFVRNYGLVWNLTKSVTINFNALTNAIIDEPNGNPDSARSYYNKQLWNNIKKLGRTKNYNQTIGVTYKVPFDKLPITDWLSSDLSYNGTYTWTAGSNGQRADFGNLLLQNTRDMGVNGKVSLDKLYNRIKFLKEVNNPTPPKPKAAQLNPDQKKDSTQKEGPTRELKGLKAALRVVMSIKSVNFSYKVTEGTKIAGYMGTANVFGMERGHDANYYSNMLPFALGWQDPNLRFKLWDDSLIAKSPLLNDQFMYTNSQNFTASTQLDPVKDLNIKLNVAKNKTSNYTELFHVASWDSISHLNYAQDAATKTGTYNISTILLGSSFLGGSGKDPTSSRAYDRFVEYRETFRNKLMSQNNISDTSLYGRNSQDVLVPAFLAAYTGKSPGKSKLTPFPAIPLPNWSISFTGLTKIAAVKKLFSTVSITHGYMANYSVSGYTSSILYNHDRGKINTNTDPGSMVMPDSINRQTGNYVPVFTMDVVNLKESFNPLIGITVKTKGKASYTLNYIRDRSLTLSLSNAQIQEALSKGITLGYVWTKANLKLPFKWKGREIPPLKNEIQFKADLTIRDNKSIQRIPGGTSTVTAGITTVQFRPQVMYKVSEKLNITFYFDRQVTIPRVSSSYRRGVTSFGIQLRFILS